MNTPAHPMADSPSPRRGRAVEIPAARRLLWAIRRELWENRSIYLAPLAAAALFLAGFLLSLIGLAARTRAGLARGPIAARQVIEQPFVTAALMLMAVALIVAVVYCLDALYGERRDHSVLFWKSLPVSDLTTVLAKASIPVLVIPLVTFAATVAVQLIMLLASSAVLAGNGISPGLLWLHVPFFETSLLNFGHLVGYHGLWYAPFYGWLLMVSAWAKRTPFLWATLPPLAIGIAEKVAFNTAHFAVMVRYRFMGDPGAAASAGGMTMDMIGPPSVGPYLTGSGLWLGLAVAAAFLFAAVRLRRDRGPI